MCVTHGMPCFSMHGTFENYKQGSSNLVCGAVRSVRGNNKKKKEGKREREERKREREKKREEEKGGKQEKEGVSCSEQTQTAKNSELCYKR